MLQQIVAKIKTILQANDLIQVVYDYERANADGSPFCTITPSSNDSDYNTTTENERVYAFMVRIFVERKGQINEDVAEDATRSLVDSVLDDFDRNYTLSGMTPPTGYTFLFMEAAPSTWGYVDGENEYRVAEIRVRCHVSVDVNLI